MNSINNKLDDMPKKVAIVQSNYIPWKGYFDMINAVDEFVFFDEMQYTKRDWRNRNKIKTPNGLKWLIIPVKVTGRFNQKINETRIADKEWSKKHWKTIYHMYNKAPYFNDYADYFETVYRKASNFTRLSDINYHFTKEICNILNIGTTLSCSQNYDMKAGKTNQLLSICLQSQADIYISGPAAKEYLNIEAFESKSILVKWMDYTRYAEYNQLYPPFEHGVTILDLIFNTGSQAMKFMNSFNAGKDV